MAKRKGDRLSNLRPGEIFGYPVDGGEGCFVDNKVAARLANKLGATWLDDICAKQLHKAMYEIGRHGTCGEIVLDTRTGANLIAFRTGHGDGFYASYWGFDRSGDVSCLVTDFCVFVKPASYELEFADAYQLIGKRRVEHKVLDRLQFLVRLRRRKDGKRGVSLEYEGGGRLKAKIVTKSGRIVGDSDRCGSSAVLRGKRRVNIITFGSTPASWRDSVLRLSITCGVKAI
jgi:hypothetical protein